jgi:hypothetical protein
VLRFRAPFTYVVLYLFCVFFVFCLYIAARLLCVVGAHSHMLRLSRVTLLGESHRIEFYVGEKLGRIIMLFTQILTLYSGIKFELKFRMSDHALFSDSHLCHIGV